VTGDVVAHVLQDSYRQARILSRVASISAARLYAYEDLMTALAEEGILDRRRTPCPPRRSSASAGAAATACGGRSSPSCWRTASARSPTPCCTRSSSRTRGCCATCAATSRPRSSSASADLVGEHRLRRELVATLVANEVVDALGPAFVSRIATELGAPLPDVVRAYRIARDVTGAVGRLAAIDALDTGLDRDVEWSSSTGSSASSRA
jgi:glutamate dehydrogenase